MLEFYVDATKLGDHCHLIETEEVHYIHSVSVIWLWRILLSVSLFIAVCWLLSFSVTISLRVTKHSLEYSRKDTATTALRVIKELDINFVLRQRQVLHRVSQMV